MNEASSAPYWIEQPFARLFLFKIWKYFISLVENMLIFL